MDKVVASKIAADVMVQEYGRYFGMMTCCLRGGCLTGPNHSGVELHGFLSYLVKCNVQGRKYSVYGYKGQQVRDNIHSADVVRFIECFIEAPRSGEVYNLAATVVPSLRRSDSLNRCPARRWPGSTSTEIARAITSVTSAICPK